MTRFPMKGLMACLALALPPAHAGSRFVLSPPASLGPGAHVLGPLPAEHPLHLEVALRRSGAPGRTAGGRPATEQLRRVVRYLADAGFTHVRVAPNGLLIGIDGTTATAEAAFHTHLARVARADGTRGFANTSPVCLPGELQKTVLAVVGLQTIHAPHAMAHPLTGGSVP